MHRFYWQVCDSNSLNYLFGNWVGHTYGPWWVGLMPNGTKPSAGSPVWRTQPPSGAPRCGSQRPWNQSAGRHLAWTPPGTPSPRGTCLCPPHIRRYCPWAGAVWCHSSCHGLQFSVKEGEVVCRFLALGGWGHTVATATAYVVSPQQDDNVGDVSWDVQLAVIHDLEGVRCRKTWKTRWYPGSWGRLVCASRGTRHDCLRTAA